VVGSIFQAHGGRNLLGPKGARVDAIGGVRGYSLLARLALQGGTLQGRELEGKDTRADVVVGARADARLGAGWQAYLHIAISGRSGDPRSRW
jgi:hypothetical protein